MSRNSFIPTEEQRAIVQTMAAYGMPHEKIVWAVHNPDSKKPISVKTLRKAFAHELTVAQAKAHAAVGHTLFMLATGGGDWTKADVQAVKWYTISQMKFTQPPQEIHHAGKDGGPIEYLDLSKLTDEQVRQLEQILIAAGRAPPGYMEQGAGGETETRH